MNLTLEMIREYLVLDQEAWEAIHAMRAMRTIHLSAGAVERYLEQGRLRF